LAVFSRLWLIGSHWATAENRHHDEPTACQLIVTNYGIAVIARFALSTESGKDRISNDRPVQDLPGRAEALAPLGKDRDPGIYDLENVIRADRETVVRRITHIGFPLWPFEPKPETIEALNQLSRSASALGFLLDVGACERQGRRIRV
jgi:hypothetical protein